MTSIPATPSESVPVLSTQEEAKFRESVRLIAALPVMDSGLQWTNDVMARLLATLDRERAASAARIATLEGALRRWMAWWDADDPEPVTGVLEQARAALAATEPRPETKYPDVDAPGSPHEEAHRG